MSADITSTTSSRVSLLLLEDNPMDAELLLYHLSQTDIQFKERVAESREQFLRALDESTPDLILSDFSLPQFTALDALQILKDRGARVPLIVVTGALGDETAAECIKAGAQDYLIKDRLGRLPQVIRHVLDIARLEKSEADTQLRLVESERRFRTLAETIPQMVWVANADGQLEYSNDRWHTYTGIPKHTGGEAQDPWARLIHEDDCGNFLKRWRHSLESGVGLEAECRMRRAVDGSYRWFLCRAFAETDDSGKPLRWFGTWTDVEEEKRAQEAMLQRQKEDSIGLMAAGIAHDFNNLLSGVLGGASLSVELLEPEHPAYPMLDIVVKASEKAAHLTQQLLACSGKANVTKRPIDLATVAPELCELLQASITKKVRVVCEVNDPVGMIKADPSQMQQIIMNLVINGSEAIGDHPGQVTVRVRSVDLNSRTSEEWWAEEPARAGEYVLLEVRDNGSGMDEATRARIFDPFFTTKFTGRGLGLAAVAGIVRNCGGAIKVESALGQGTTFRILLPATEERASQKSTVGARKYQKAAEMGVLIVDDEDIVRRTLAAIVGGFGATSFLAESGAAGVKLFEERLDRIDVVVLDVNMPGQSVVETIKGLRQVRPDVPIVLATGYSSMEVDSYVQQFERIQFLPKPFTSASLKETLLGALGIGGAVQAGV